MSHHEKLKRMIDESKITKAANQYNESVETELAKKKLLKRTSAERFAESITRQCAFEVGAKWMQEEFLEDLLHQTDEEPQGYDEWILIHYNVGNYYSLAQVKEFKSWKGFVERAPIENWLYIDDLFQKEGGSHD